MMIGKTCPNFIGKLVKKNEIIEIDQEYLRNKRTLLFFYAVDFSAVCPTELYALQDHIAEFGKRTIEIIGVSVDSAYTHAAWLRTKRIDGGIEGVDFALLSDLSHTLSKNLGTYDFEQGIAYRGTFIIDEELIIQYASINNMALGRSTAEILRIIDALDFVKKTGGVCPANWTPINQSTP